nr:MAG TPA: hypothetical protein [Caudoviricetes sp.]
MCMYFYINTCNCIHNITRNKINSNFIIINLYLSNLIMIICYIFNNCTIICTVNNYFRTI